MGVNQELKALYNLYKNIKQKNGGGGSHGGEISGGEVNQQSSLSLVKRALKVKRYCTV